MLKLTAPNSTQAFINLFSKTIVVGALATFSLLSTVNYNGRANEAPPMTVSPVSAAARLTLSQARESSRRFADGVYLYGQAAAANQNGSAYLVFESRADRFIGAFYMPNSSFDCVHGQIEADQLDMTIVNSYGEGTYGYTVEIAGQSEVANNGAAVPELGLDGFNAIPELTEMDQTVLATCVSNYASQVW